MICSICKKRLKESGELFVNKCPVCHEERIGRKDPNQLHLVKTVCSNPLCEFKNIQIFHEDNYK